jgi:hypothetical protein
MSYGPVVTRWKLHSHRNEEPADNAETEINRSMSTGPFSFRHSQMICSATSLSPTSFLSGHSGNGVAGNAIVSTSRMQRHKKAHLLLDM